MIQKRVARTTDYHGTNGKYFLGVCVGGHVTKAYTSETATCEVQGGQVTHQYVGFDHGSSVVLATVKVQVAAEIKTLAQFVQPT